MEDVIDASDADHADAIEGNANVSQPSDQGDAHLADLPGSDALDGREASKITGAARTAFVVLCGPVASGKTTLLTSIYEKFGEGPFAGYIFAGSRTLMGFESRSFLGRTASYLKEANTERTPLENVRQFLHLCVRVEDLSRAPQDIILPDVTGELFEDAQHSTDDSRRLEMLKRADRVVVLVDGEKIVKPAQRHGAHVAADSFIRRCIESGMLGVDTAVDLVFTKWDLVADGDKEAGIQFVDEVSAELEATYGERLGLLRFCRVAACPQNEKLPFAYGIEELFREWPDARRPATLSDRESVEPAATREFDRIVDRMGKTLGR